MIDWNMESLTREETWLGLSDLEEKFKSKTRTRTLFEYDQLLFGSPGSLDDRDYGAVINFVKNSYGDEIDNLKHLVEAIYSSVDRPVVWAEMGGGGSIAMRQLTSLPGMREKLLTVNVDLFDFDDKSLDMRTLKEMAKKTPKALRPENKPILIKENIEEVALPWKADIITSINSIFYVDNPLGSICNWYNQLTESGLLVVASEENWTDWIRYKEDKYFLDAGPMNRFLGQLDEAGVEIITTGKREGGLLKNNRFNLMMMKRNPEIKLELESDVDDVFQNVIGRKEVFYPRGNLVSVRPVPSQV